MSRLGWHFIFVGMFAMLGGAIRGFNLPLVLSGLIVGALLMQWRLSRRMLEAVESRRRLPGEAFVGQSFAVRFLITNHSRWVPALLLRIDDQVDAPVLPGKSIQSSQAGTRLGASGIVAAQKGVAKLASLFRRDSAVVAASCGLGKVPAQATVAAQYDCVAKRRGRYDFGPSIISTGMPLGLMVIRRTSVDAQSMYVFPEILPLRRGWRQRLQSRSGGISTTSRRSGANDGDFFGLRSWQAGDSRRWIHWRTTARIGEPAVRQFEQQKRFDLCILVDAILASPSPVAHADVEFVISAAASMLTQIVPTPTNRVALAVAGVKNGVVAGAGNREQLNAMLRLLADLVPAGETDLAGAVDQVFRSVGKPQDLVVISPRTMPAEADRIQRLLSGRCTLRWYCVSDGSLDQLVDRASGIETQETAVASA